MSDSGIAATFDVAEDLSPVEADKNQLKQVMLNIVENARMAMPRGGSLHVEAKN